MQYVYCIIVLLHVGHGKKSYPQLKNLQQYYFVNNLRAKLLNLLKVDLTQDINRGFVYLADVPLMEHFLARRALSRLW